jgi:hypothetical protein
VDQSKLSTKVKNAAFGTLKKLFLKKADDERDYDPLAMIEKLGLKDSTLVVDRFIPNEEVPPYFQAADTIVLFYETATPSGVESLSYNFKLPAVATRAWGISQRPLPTASTATWPNRRTSPTWCA